MPAEFLQRFRLPVLVLLGGVLLISLGILFFKSRDLLTPTKIEIINSSPSAEINKKEITVEISGEVVKPAVYKLGDGSRVDDLITLAGGLTAKADRAWTDKYLNRASKLVDGQKVYIPKIGNQLMDSSAKTNAVDQTTSGAILGQNTNLVNINTASLSELDKLAGIGPVYGQNIIEHRPYSNTEELLSKGVLKKSVYDKIKDQISVY